MNKDAGSVYPRPEHVTVRCLGPAGVRQVPVNVRWTQVHPVGSSDAVSQSVAGTRDLGHFGVSGRATREEHLHRVRAQRTSRLYTQSHQHAASEQLYEIF